MAGRVTESSLLGAVDAPLTSVKFARYQQFFPITTIESTETNIKIIFIANKSDIKLSRDFKLESMWLSGEKIALKKPLKAKFLSLVVDEALKIDKYSILICENIFWQEVEDVRHKNKQSR